jgi:hypothetical protein
MSATGDRARMRRSLQPRPPRVDTPGARTQCTVHGTHCPRCPRAGEVRRGFDEDERQGAGARRAPGRAAVCEPQERQAKGGGHRGGNAGVPQQRHGAGLWSHQPHAGARHGERFLQGSVHTQIHTHIHTRSHTQCHTHIHTRSHTHTQCHTHARTMRGRGVHGKSNPQSPHARAKHVSDCACNIKHASAHSRMVGRALRQGSRLPVKRGTHSCIAQKCGAGTVHCATTTPTAPDKGAGRDTALPATPSSTSAHTNAQRGSRSGVPNSPSPSTMEPCTRPKMGADFTRPSTQGGRATSPLASTQSLHNGRVAQTHQSSHPVNPPLP